MWFWWPADPGCAPLEGCWAWEELEVNLGGQCHQLLEGTGCPFPLVLPGFSFPSEIRSSSSLLLLQPPKGSHHSSGSSFSPKMHDSIETNFSWQNTHHSPGAGSGFCCVLFCLTLSTNFKENCYDLFLQLRKLTLRKRQCLLKVLWVEWRKQVCLMPQLKPLVPQVS